jgi:hypothetical protein
MMPCASFTGGVGPGEIHWAQEVVVRFECGSVDVGRFVLGGMASIVTELRQMK